tara:strand:+ start:16816 stop:17424 length:609 start_codon:yes stop_codon:yes gene_type:complete
MKLLREYIRELLVETAEADERDLLALKTGREIKQYYAKNADQQFLDSLVTVHWVRPQKLMQTINVGSRNELSVRAYLPGQINPESYELSMVGLVIDGRITLLSNEDLNTGYGSTAARVGGEHRAQSSGVNKGTYHDMDELLSPGFLVLDSKDFIPGSANEALVDNWSIKEIMVPDNLMSVVSEETEGLGINIVDFASAGVIK